MGWGLRLYLREAGKQRSLSELKGGWKDISKLPILKRGKKIISGKRPSQETAEVTSRAPFQPNLLDDSMKS